MTKYHASWADSKHRNIACVDCHYAPGTQHTLAAKFKGLSQLFSYLATKEQTVRKKARIDDKSCTTASCHPLDKKFTLKKVKFTENVSYLHQTHFDKTIEGQKLHCATCHQHWSPEKHFEVPEEICFLCHFKNTTFNEGRSRCDLCHEITDKPLQKQFREGTPESNVKLITHQSLREANVACTACHIELIRGDGDIKKEACLDCHETGEAVEKFDEKKLMHQVHVAGAQAMCLECHQPIIHKEMDDILELVRSECATCHPDHHLYQQTLLTGEAVEGVQGTPALMAAVKTNCLACHVKEDIDAKGQKILRASPVACVACHTNEHDQMLADWKATVEKELDAAKKTHTEASQAFEREKKRLSKEDAREYEGMLKEGSHYLHIIEFGHGAHNKKYSLKLIDKALDNFEDIIDELSEDGQS